MQFLFALELIKKKSSKLKTLGVTSHFLKNFPQK